MRMGAYYGTMLIADNKSLKGKVVMIHNIALDACLSYNNAIR